MNQPLDSKVLAQLFTEARSHHHWTDRPVTDADLQKIYDLFKWAPTSVNSMPARFIAVRSNEAKQKLLPALMESNRAQVLQAPVSVIIAYDEKFYEKLDKLWPAYDVKPYFTQDAKTSFDTAFRNSSMQGAYFMLAARSLGFDVGPLSGFNNGTLDEIFFKGTSLKSNFICMVGEGDPKGLYARGPRLDFEESFEIA